MRHWSRFLATHRSAWRNDKALSHHRSGLGASLSHRGYAWSQSDYWEISGSRGPQGRFCLCHREPPGLRWTREVGLAYSHRSGPWYHQEQPWDAQGDLEDPGAQAHQEDPNEGAIGKTFRRVFFFFFFLLNCCYAVRWLLQLGTLTCRYWRRVSHAF